MFEPALAGAQVGVEEVAALSELAEKPALLHGVDPRVHVVAQVSLQSEALVLDAAERAPVALFADLEARVRLVHDLLQIQTARLICVADHRFPLCGLVRLVPENATPGHLSIEFERELTDLATSSSSTSQRRSFDTLDFVGLLTFWTPSSFAGTGILRQLSIFEQGTFLCQSVIFDRVTASSIGALLGTFGGRVGIFRPA